MQFSKLLVATVVAGVRKSDTNIRGNSICLYNIGQLIHSNTHYHPFETKQMQNIEFKSSSPGQQPPKLKSILFAKQQDRKSNPQGESKFFEQQWIDFEIEDNKEFLKLCTYRHQPQNIPKAVLIMFHGFCCHMNHGAHIAQELTSINVVTVGFDHRGFGKSQGKKGYIQSLETHLSDSEKFVKLIKGVYPTLPIFAMGLSMGGMTIYNLALKDKTLFKGVILMAPSLRGILPDALGKIFCKISSIMPNSTKVLPPFYGVMSKNPQVVEDLKNDELTHKGGLPLKSLNVLIDAKYNSASTFKDFDVPFVIIQGGLDKLVNPKGAFELYQQSCSNDKHLWYYENMWHDVWHEEEIYEIIQRMKGWLFQRI